MKIVKLHDDAFINIDGIVSFRRIGDNVVGQANLDGIVHSLTSTKSDSDALVAALNEMAVNQDSVRDPYVLFSRVNTHLKEQGWQGIPVYNDKAVAEMVKIYNQWAGTNK